MTLTKHLFGWPEWAPPRLVNLHAELVRMLAEGGIDSESFQAKDAETIETLCTDARMERVWNAIDQHASRADYQSELSAAVTVARWNPPRFQSLTPAQQLKKRKKAAAEARKLRNTLREMGFEAQTVFPVMGARAMSLPIEFFLDGQGVTLPTDAPEWTHELKTLNALMMTNCPGIGSWGEILERLAKSIENGTYDGNHTRVDGPDDLPGRARNFALHVATFLNGLCNRRLNPEVIRLTEIFFPDVDVDPAAFGMLLTRQARAVTSPLAGGRPDAP